MGQAFYRFVRTQPDRHPRGRQSGDYGCEINAKCRRLDNLGLVLIDYLQLMTAAAPGKSGDNRVTVVSDISPRFKIMAKELNVPVICLSQLSRANESRTDKRPMLSDLRESGAIEQDADSVMFLYRDEYYNPNTQDKNIAECIVAKKPSWRDRNSQAAMAAAVLHVL